MPCHSTVALCASTRRAAVARVLAAAEASDFRSEVRVALEVRIADAVRIAVDVRRSGARRSKALSHVGATPDFKKKAASRRDGCDAERTSQRRAAQPRFRRSSRIIDSRREGSMPCAP